jgi:molybdopterin-guanine dinucleotide biosynthesis protein A
MSSPSGRNATILREAVKLDASKVLRIPAGDSGAVTGYSPVLVILAAGKGTRFGQAPKCAQLVGGVPLARHSIDAFRGFSPSPVVCVVGYRHDEVMSTVGEGCYYVRSENPTGGTAFAAFEALSVPGLEEKDPVLVITMGDRIVAPSVFRKLYETHTAGQREADLTLLTAVYEPPRNKGKGRIVRDDRRCVRRIVEQRDIDALPDAVARQALDDLIEANCPLYAIRAGLLRRCLEQVRNDNAQGQFYLTDIVETISARAGDIRTITTTIKDPEYDLLCSDVTRPMDLALLEGILSHSRSLFAPAADAVELAVQRITAERPAVQVAAIASQLEELAAVAESEQLGFLGDRPVGIGISGGRLRIAFMHPDMGRFFGPAWQMPIGAGNPSGREQIVIVAQCSEDRKIHLFPTNPHFRERLNFISADDDCMFPGEEVADWYTYEGFGTRMSENLLLSLGYFTDEEIRNRRDSGIPLPPPSLWVSTNMRRPFSLIGNAIASLRTLRKGNLGAKVQAFLGREGFRGMRLVSTGNIPQGGFSSSSAVTVATKNAINSLFDLQISPDVLVHLACQAEYGTGVRAGSLDQATEQKGRSGQGTLISSNPRDNYRILATYPVPADRIQMIFPYSVDRDRTAWRWSAGVYAEARVPGRQTAAEMRKMTGKAAEIAAILTHLPLDVDLFKHIEDDLVQSGTVSASGRKWVYGILKELPLLASQKDLRDRVQQNRQWYIGQLIEVNKLSPIEASEKTDAAFDSLFTGWRDPVLRRAIQSGDIVEETGVPLRAIVAYLFGEVAKNFWLIAHPADWIEYVTLSQRGDCCFDVDPNALPSRADMIRELEWESHCSGPELLELWLAKFGAKPFDFNRGLDDSTLSRCPELHLMQGTNFFRGLALIDIAEAMLKKAFGKDAVAVRVNAAGQGDFFQVHIDVEKADPGEVKEFIKQALYYRFGLFPKPEFVETHPGGGAAGVRLNRFDQLPELVSRLRAAVIRHGAEAVSSAT